MRKTIEKLWFQPYTPFVLFALLIFGLSQIVYPAFQRGIQQDNMVNTISVTPQPVLADETSIITSVSKLIRLPDDEKPQLITITEVEQFKNQAFFRDAKNGDILLIYQKSKKAILYDPKANIIIDTAPIVASESGQSASTSSL